MEKFLDRLNELLNDNSKLQFYKVQVILIISNNSVLYHSHYNPSKILVDRKK